MNKKILSKMMLLTLVLLGGLLLASPAAADPPDHVENPPQGTTPSEFATDYSGCLGSLRSAIARGEFAGVGPFEEHFDGQVNPGAHQGTVGEEEFLRDLLASLGLEISVEEFCAGF